MSTHSLHWDRSGFFQGLSTILYSTLIIPRMTIPLSLPIITHSVVRCSKHCHRQQQLAKTLNYRASVQFQFADSRSSSWSVISTSPSHSSIHSLIPDRHTYITLSIHWRPYVVWILLLTTLHSSSTSIQAQIGADFPVELVLMTMKAI